MKYLNKVTHKIIRQGRIVKLIAFCFFIALKSDGQITRNNWLVGGNASFSYLTSSSESVVKYDQTDFQITPLLGYFLKDKFAVGLKPSVSYVSNNSGNTYIVTKVGPFLRYYFLQPENKFNLFAESSYEYGIITGKGFDEQKLHAFSFSGGPVLYFNSCIGLEFIVAYSTTKFLGFEGNNNEIRLGLGFQIHLEKE